MEAIAELPFVAGNPALDFINTAEGREDPPAGEALLTADDLRTWGERYGLISSPVKHTDRSELERAIAARELLYRLAFARAHARPYSSSDLADLADLAAEAHSAGHLDSDHGLLTWKWPRDQLSTVRHSTVAAAVALLADTPADRLKQCPGDHCGWFFLDATKRGNRRWCKMSECGQAAKTAKRRSKSTDHTGRR